MHQTAEQFQPKENESQNHRRVVSLWASSAGFHAAYHQKMIAA